MFPKKIRWIIIGIIVMLSAAGCKCNNAAVEAFEFIADSPIGGDLVSSLTPTFDWHGSDTCDPDQYWLYIKEDIQYGGDTVYEHISYTDVPYTLTGDSLLPGRAYYWYGIAVNEPSSEDNGASGEYSAPAYFYTGPVCSGEPLVSPILEIPRQWGGNSSTDNWITHNHLQEFKWTYEGGCLPLYYDYQFATDPMFTDIILSGTTTTPYEQSIFETFPNCSTIFWRVAANDGTTVGPWSPSWSFHWVREGTECYQTHYISDEAARIDVQLYWDDCSLTGYNSSAVLISDPGCKADDISTIIVADGEQVHPSPDFVMGGSEVDLGSGPCPSTGLDHKKWSQLPFNVLAPGTYCISITRDQTLDAYPHAYLMDGIWSEPRTNDVVAYQTVEVGPGTSDIMVEFGWDEYDRVFLIPEFDFTMECRFCPDPIGPVTGFLFAGQPVPVYGRDYLSNWKLSEVEGMACYALIPDALMDEALAMMEGMELRSADLGQYPTPLPCPEPEKLESETKQKTCWDYKNKTTCENRGCTWYRVNDNTSLCIPPQ